MRKTIYISFLLVIISLFSVCAPEQTDVVAPKKIKPEKSLKNLIIQANNEALRQFKTEYKNNRGNIIISPLNINSILPFVFFSADLSNNTAYNELKEELKTFNHLIFNLDNRFNISRQTVLNFNKIVEFEQNFNRFLEKNKDFKLKYIDNQYTYKKETFIEIENHLNGEFTYSNQTDIGEAPFYLSPDKSKFVEMLICEDAFNFYSDDYMKAVEVPIGQGNFSALFIIPETGFSLNRIIKALNPYILKTVENNYRKLKMAVYIPKIDINNTRESKGNTPYIYSLNMKKIKLKNINNKENFYISDILYHTGLKSISKVKYKKKTNKNNSLFIDRPFVFIITEKYTGSIVFIGQIIKP
ncbi:MAG: serpin family protein [Bacteroidales bacterium]|nr:serpin family protein [Bacteroidales bacterium]